MTAPEARPAARDGPRRPLDLLFVGRLPPHPGGAALSCAQLLTGFVRSGHAVRVLSPITAEQLSAGDVFAEAHPEMAVARFLIPYVRSDTHRAAPSEYRQRHDEQVRERLAALVDARRPDLIMIGQEDFGPTVSVLAESRGIPCVLRSAGIVTYGVLTGQYPPDVAADIVAGLRRVALVVTQAPHMSGDLRTLGCHNARVVPNAIDLDAFQPGPKSAMLLRELAAGPDDVVVLHASNLKPVKRPLDVVGAAARALRRDPRLLYVVVGDGMLRQAMEEACHSAGLSARFRFVGWIDYARMPDYVNLADVVIMPSEAEGLARVYLETQACGRLLLASDIPAARDVVKDGETGLLFRLGDLDDFAGQTVRAAGDPALRAAIGERARARVARHSIVHAVAAYLDIFDAVVRRHRG
jgi:glycosyltransferase involved in cell wall biosynthesis